MDILALAKLVKCSEIVQLKCDFCTGLFARSGNELKNKILNKKRKHVYCSKICAGKAVRNGRAARAKARRKQKDLLVRC